MGHELHAVIHQPLHILLLRCASVPPSINRSLVPSAAAAGAAAAYVSAPRTIYREITLCIFAVEVGSNELSSSLSSLNEAFRFSLPIALPLFGAVFFMTLGTLLVWMCFLHCSLGNLYRPALMIEWAVTYFFGPAFRPFHSRLP